MDAGRVMLRGSLVVIVALVVAGAGIWLVAATTDNPTPAALVAMPDDVDIERGAVLYAENCAACHGADLEGQADWQVPGEDGILPAPPHDATGHTWHHADRLLFEYTALGGAESLARMGVEFDSGMPGFADVLEDQDIWNILAYIQSTWPDRLRDIQAQRTTADLAEQEDS